MPDSVLEGAKELLVDTITALHQSSVRDFIVIGGWCPLLRNASGLRHPGTLDVDVLFKHGGEKGALRPAIEALKSSGFVLSAKHSFQLLMEKNVLGERLVYNVDLLHPSMTETNPGMYVDHLELDVPLDEEERRVKTMTSIVMPNSAILFQESLYSKFKLDGIDFDLVDFTGMFITKMDSCEKQKRERDAFDMYIALKSNEIDFLALRRIRGENPRIDRSLAGLSEYLEKKNQIFDQNVAQFSAGLSESPSTALLLALRKSA